MANPGDFAYTVKQQADIVRVVGEYVKLKKAGAQNFSGLCPFHNEKTPSFSVHATRQFYHCFGCGASGDVLSFVQKIENITFPEAVRAVAQKVGVPLPRISYSSPGEAREARLRGALLDIHERACGFFQEQLQRPEAAPAREYLAGRGLGQDTSARFRIGYAPDSGFLLRDRLRGEFDDEVMKASGLFSWKEDKEDSRSFDSAASPASGESGLAQDDRVRGQDGAATRQDDRVRGQDVRGQDDRVRGQDGAATRQDDRVRGQDGAATQDDRVNSEDEGLKSRNDGGKRGVRSTLYAKFRNRIMFPICNEAGKVIAFTGRTLATEEKAGPKYLNSPETAIYSKSRVLFNLDQAKEAIRKLDYALLVEGQMDCISVFAAGFHNVIASSGTAFTEPQARLLSRFSKNLVVNFDPDTAGAAATERTLGLLVGEEFQIKVITLEPGFDPDLFVRRRGAEAYAAALRDSQKYFDYLIERARAQFPARSPEGKVKAVNFLLPHIQRVPSRIVRDELAREIAQKLEIDSAVLRQELRHAASQRSAAKVSAAAEPQVTEAERILVRALASAAQMSADEEARISARDGAEEEFDPARQARFILTRERLHEGLAAESLVEALLGAGPGAADPMAMLLSEPERRLLAAILMREEEELTVELLEGAIEALRRRHLERRQRQIQVQIADAERRRDPAGLARLVQEKVAVDRALAGFLPGASPGGSA